MKSNLITILFFLLCAKLSATVIPGGNVSGIWTPAGSPYYINGDIIVPATGTLEIKPGVQVIFNNTFGITVDGKLKCQGTPTDSIFFFTSGPAINWKGIVVNGSSTALDSLEIRYCVFSKMNDGISPNYFNYLFVSHCRFFKNILAFEDTYFTTTTYSEIRDNFFHDNNNIYFTNNGRRLLSLTSKSKVINNVFRNNKNGCLRIYAGNISDTAVIQHNLFDLSGGTGGNSANIYGTNVNAKFSDNVFKNNTSTFNYSNPGLGAIYLSTKYVSFERDSFINNVAPSGRGGAMYLDVGSKLAINNCYFKDNMAIRTGVGAYGDLYAEHGTTVTINNSAFEHSLKKSIFIDNNSKLTVNRCRFTNGTETVINSPDGNIIKVTNTLFANNDGYVILAANYAELTVGNCTFANNTNSMGGYSKGIYAYNLFKLNIYNSNFWSCASGTCGYDIYIHEPLTIASTIAVKNCNIQGGFANVYVNGTTIGTYTNNINSVPLFKNPSPSTGTVTPANYDYSVMSSSPLINKGIPDTSGLVLGDFDLTGLPRVMADTIDIGAYEMPHQPIILQSQTQFSFCENSNAGISFQAVGEDTLTYMWLHGSTLLSNTSNVLSFTNIIPADSGYYSFIVKNSVGADTLIFHLKINALPSVSFTVASNMYCLSDPSVAISGGSPSNGLYSGQGVSSNSFLPANAGVGDHLVTYTYSDNLGCINSDTVTFHVNPLPLVSFTTTQTLHCISNSSVSLTGGIPLNGIYSGQGVSSGVFDPAIAGAGTHLISYTYTDSQGCSNIASQSFTVDLCTGVAQIDVLNNVVVYPNPSKGNFKITSGAVILSAGIIHISGKNVLHFDHINSNEYDVDAAGLSAGMYYLKISTENSSYLKKLIIN